MACVAKDCEGFNHCQWANPTWSSSTTISYKEITPPPHYHQHVPPHLDHPSPLCPKTTTVINPSITTWNHQTRAWSKAAPSTRELIAPRRKKGINILPGPGFYDSSLHFRQKKECPIYSNPFFLDTPRKINMEHNSECFEKWFDWFAFSTRWFSGSMFIF